MKTLQITTLFLLQFILSVAPLYSQNTNLEQMILNISVHDPADCHIIKSGSRSTDISDTLEVVMDSTGGYNLGTGFVYKHPKDNQKYIITCEHVVYKAGEIFGYDRHRNKYELEPFGGDSFYDIAVLKFKYSADADNFKSVSFSKNVQAGESVTSVGYWTWGGNPSTYIGEILDASQRPYFELPLNKTGFITSDALTSEGFSGGPLLNEKSRVVGMNSAVNKSDNISYALGGKRLKKIVDEIITKNKINRPFLGIQFSQNQKTDIVQINDIIENSPAAAHASKLNNQHLKSIDGKTVNNLYDVLEIMEEIKPNMPVTLGLSKGSITITTDIIDDNDYVAIACHAINENDHDRAENIVQENGRIIISYNDGKTALVTSAGHDERLRVYCIDDFAQLGMVIRTYIHLFNEVQIGRENREHTKKTTIKFPTPVLYY